jgi:hypothetical protein
MNIIYILQCMFKVNDCLEQQTWKDIGELRETMKNSLYFDKLTENLYKEEKPWRIVKRTEEVIWENKK